MSRQVDTLLAKIHGVMKMTLTNLALCFTFLPTLALAQAVEEKAPPLPPLQYVPEKVTDTHNKGKSWVINEKFALAHQAKPLDHAPFMVTIMPTEVGKVLYLTRPKVSELVRFSLTNKEKKLAESIRFTTLTMPTNLPMDVRLAKSAELLEKQLAPNFAQAHKNLTIARRYKTKVGPYNAAVVLGKITLKDDSVLFMKVVAILRQNNHQGIIAVMFLDPSAGKKEDFKQRLEDGYVQQVLHSFRFLKKKAPSLDPTPNLNLKPAKNTAEEKKP